MYDCAVVAICVRLEKNARKTNEHVRIMQCIISLGNIPSIFNEGIFQNRTLLAVFLCRLVFVSKCRLFLKFAN